MRCAVAVRTQVRLRRVEYVLMYVRQITGSEGVKVWTSHAVAAKAQRGNATVDDAFFFSFQDGMGGEGAGWVGLGSTRARALTCSHIPGGARRRRYVDIPTRER